MIFPIDHTTFNRERNSRKPFIRGLETYIDIPWKYWMTTRGDVIAILGKYLITFDDDVVDLTIDPSQWDMKLIGTDKPKEMILNHLHRGGPSLLHDSIKSGMYQLSCPRVGISYEVWIEDEESYGYHEIYFWWKEKVDFLRSLPLIYEMNNFYSAILWKKI